VTGKPFIRQLREEGCKVVFYVEYVPVESRELALDDASRVELATRLQTIRAQNPGQIFISFPGDEKETGGCLAAGRGFFHVNAAGGIEPCPFSPYSDMNIRDRCLREALNSSLFAKLRESGMLHEDHAGGCVLFEKRELVEQMVESYTESYLGICRLPHTNMPRRPIMDMSSAINQPIGLLPSPVCGLLVVAGVTMAKVEK